MILRRRDHGQVPIRPIFDPLPREVVRIADASPLGIRKTKGLPVAVWPKLTCDWLEAGGFLK